MLALNDLTPVNLLHPDAKMPVKATPEAAAYDIWPTGIGTVYPGESKIFGTGVALKLPPGLAILALSRSGMGFNYDVTLANSVGLIDEDYIGEIKLKLTRPLLRENLRVCYEGGDDYELEFLGEPFEVSPDKAIAQLLVVEAKQLSLYYSEGPLPQTKRGEEGFGHSDHKKYQ